MNLNLVALLVTLSSVHAPENTESAKEAIMDYLDVTSEVIKKTTTEEKGRYTFFLSIKKAYVSSGEDDRFCAKAHVDTRVLPFLISAKTIRCNLIK